MTSLHTARAPTHKFQNKSSFNGHAPTTGQKYAPGNGSGIDNQLREESDFGDERQDVENEVDDSVKEDMKKLEDSFRGISDRFRLVDRIGEGSSILHPASVFFN